MSANNSSVGKARWSSGPWHIDGHDLSAVIRKVSDVGSAGTWECIAKCSGNDWGENWRENARLIASAPELYDALEAVLAEWREGYGLRCKDQVEAALSKALGKTA